MKQSRSDTIMVTEQANTNTGAPMSKEIDPNMSQEPDPNMSNKTEPTESKKSKPNRNKKSETKGAKKMKGKKYMKELRKLQAALCKLQDWVKHKGLRVMILF